MTILVAGSAGLIVVNFVLDWSAMNDETVVSLDKLAYFGQTRKAWRVKASILLLRMILVVQNWLFKIYKAYSLV